MALEVLLFPVQNRCNKQKKKKMRHVLCDVRRLSSGQYEVVQTVWLQSVSLGCQSGRLLEVQC